MHPRHPDAERLSAVLGEVYRRARRKPPAQIRALLDQQLQAAGVSYPQDAKDHFVQSLATEPPWLVGVLFGRSSRRKREAEGREWLATAPNPEHPEMDALADRLLKLRGVSRVSWSSSDCDRIVYVSLNPWSDKLADRVRRKATPREVRFLD
jgi:hypothetical protein